MTPVASPSAPAAAARRAEAAASGRPADEVRPRRAANRRTSATQPVLGPWIRAQALNLTRHTDALRDFSRAEFGSGPEAPTDGHVQAVNYLMTRLREGLTGRARRMIRLAADARQQPSAERLTTLVTHKHQAHVWVKGIEKIWDFYFELFGQRQSRFGVWLLSTDRIALDCYQVTYLGIGKEKSVPAPPPFCYMRTGFGLRRTNVASSCGSLAGNSTPFR